MWPSSESEEKGTTKLRGRTKGGGRKRLYFLMGGAPKSHDNGYRYRNGWESLNSLVALGDTL